MDLLFRLALWAVVTVLVWIHVGWMFGILAFVAMPFILRKF